MICRGVSSHTHTSSEGVCDTLLPQKLSGNQKCKHQKMKNLLPLLFVLFCLSSTYAQVGVNSDGSAPHSSAILDVKSTTKAFYPPRMNTGAKEGIVSVQAGALVYDVNAQDLNFFTGSLWLNVAKLNLPILQFGTSNSSDGLLSLTNNSLSGFTTGIRANIQGDQGFGVVGNAYKTNPTLQSIGVAGFNSSTNANGMGVYGEHAGNGSGVSGKAFGATGVGVKGVSQSASGVGVFGENTSNGVGVIGNSNLNIGLKGTTVSGKAIQGEATGSGNAANFVSATETTVNIQLSDLAPALSKNALEVTNNSENNIGIGIKGLHQSAGTGVMGETQGGTGVHGIGYNGVKGEGYYGVHGIGSNYGVFGEKTGTTGSAVHGVGGLRGVYGQSDAYGVYGVSNFLEPNQYKYSGVYGESNSNNNLGSGVYGNHNGLGPGVSGNSFYGIGGRFNSDNGIALITQSGNVGIGTNTPVAKMDIMGSLYLSHFYYGANEDTYIRGGKAGSDVLINDIAGQGNVGIGVTNPAYILDIKDRIRLRANGSNTAGLYLNNAANTTWTAFAGMKTDTQVGLFIGGTWRFWVDNAGSGYLNGNLIQTSDKRLKQDFSVLTNSLSDIYKLKGYHFKWIEASRSQDLQTGLIAQEVQKIFPELVQTDEKGFLSVNYIGLIPHLIEAVKELRNENELLKSNEANSKHKNQTLENRLEKVEAMLTILTQNNGK
jgi:Chaperone of endosialidase